MFGMVSSEMRVALAFVAVLVCATSVARTQAQSNPKADVGAAKKNAPLNTTESERDFYLDFAQVRTFAKTKDLDGLENFAKTTIPKWQTDRVRYLLFTTEVVAVLTGFDFKDKRQFSLAQSYIDPLLQKPDELPLADEAQMVRFWAVAEAYGPTKKTEEWPQRRVRAAKLWLHAMKRIEARIDPTFDPYEMKNIPRMNLSVPGMGTGGIDPKAIKNPELRQRYEAALAANEKLSIKRDEQIEARDLEKRFLPLAQRHLINLYQKAPNNRSELSQLLADSGVSEARRDSILNSLKAETEKKERKLENAPPAKQT